MPDTIDYRYWHYYR